MTPHPLEILSPDRQRRLFWPLLAATLLLTLALNAAGDPLTTPEAPYGIVSYELASSLGRARRILDAWDGLARERAAFSLGLDYLYMLAYAACISLACLWSAGRLKAARSSLARWGRPLSWAPWLAGLLDAFENLALVLLLFGSRNPALPPVAAACAAVKFALIFAGLGYAGLGLAAGKAR